MLKQLLRFSSYVTLITLAVMCHSAFGYIVPAPWNSINIPIVFLSLIFIWRETGAIVWIAFFTYTMLEIFARTPYGIELFAGTVAWLTVFWLYEYFFTNQSWYTVAVLSAATVLLYRTLLMIAIVLVDFFSTDVILRSGSGAMSLLWEIAMTCGATTTLFVCLRWFHQRRQRPSTLIWT